MNSLKRENNLLKVEIATLKNRLNMQLKQNRAKKNFTRKAITQKTIKKGTATRKNTPLVLNTENKLCLLYTSPSPRDKRQSRMPSSA